MSATTLVQRPVRGAARPVRSAAPARHMRSARAAARPVARSARPVARPTRTARVAPARRRPNVALRRRIAAVLTVAVVVLAICAAWAMRSYASPEGGVVEATVVVAPGETVWDIAYDYAPQGQHPQAYIAEVLRYNGVDAGAVAPGTVLRLPRP